MAVVSVMQLVCLMTNGTRKTEHTEPTGVRRACSQTPTVDRYSKVMMMMIKWCHTLHDSSATQFRDALVGTQGPLRLHPPLFGHCFGAGVLRRGARKVRRATAVATVRRAPRPAGSHPRLPSQVSPVRAVAMVFGRSSAPQQRPATAPSSGGKSPPPTTMKRKVRACA